MTERHARANDIRRLRREVRIERRRASGPGGQHVNKTESAVRVTHLPTGLVAVAADTPSQIRNLSIALQRLSDKIAAHNRVVRPRKATKPSRAAQARRLQIKRQRAATKVTRRRPVDD